MKTSQVLKPVAIMALACTLFVGCQSKQDAAIEQAKKQAAATGQPQQVVTVDKNGNTTTATVQPPAPGQTAQTVTTTVTPAASVPANTPAVAGQPAGTDQAVASGQTSAATPVPGGNPVIVPKGTPVGGIVAASHKRGHFKGQSILELRLTSMTLNGTRYPLDTSSLTRTKKGKGKRSAAIIGGGSGLGMLIGGVATGGAGLLIGGLAGAGAGTAAAGLTGNRDIDIPAESIVHFKLADDLVVQPS